MAQTVELQIIHTGGYLQALLSGTYPITHILFPLSSFFTSLCCFYTPCIYTHRRLYRRLIHPVNLMATMIYQRMQGTLIMVTLWLHSIYKARIIKAL